MSASAVLVAESASREISFQSLSSLDNINEIVFENESVFRWDPDRIRAVRLELIRDAFKLHFHHNEDYRRYCMSFSFSPDQLVREEDLSRVPRLPSTLFKLTTVRTCEAREVVKECTSSGTRGSVSRVVRDEKTLGRFFGSVRCALDQVLGIHDAFCVHLGPSQSKAADLWFSYVMAATELVFQTAHLMHDRELPTAEAVEQVRRALREHEHALVIGAPVMFLRVLDYMEQNGVVIENADRVVVVTAGGWKRFSGAAIPRPELHRRLQKQFLGLRDESIRDFFNMVELNTVLPECEYHVKHVPPWLHVDLFEPTTLRPAKSGELGLLSYLDPTATSYPGFVLTDDFCRVTLEDGQRCACGRRGPGIDIIRRVNKGESRGCALKLDHSHVNAGKKSS